MSFVVPQTPTRRQTRLSLRKSDVDSYRIGTSFAVYQTRQQSLSHVAPELVPRKAVKKLKCLLNTKWQIFKVSPFYNWQTSEASLKRYAQRLKAKVSTVDSEKYEYKTAYSTIPNLCVGASDGCAIEVTVQRTSGSYSREAYCGIFLSWGRRVNVNCPGSVALPILLCKGYKRIREIVHNEFEQIHDCIITPNSFEDDDLRCITFGNFAIMQQAEENSVVIEVYAPKRMNSGTLEITLQIHTLFSLWKRIHASNSQTWNVQEVNTFWEEVCHHVKSAFGISLERCHIKQLHLPHLMISPDWIYVKKLEEMNLALCYVMGNFAMLESATPSLYYT